MAPGSSWKLMSARARVETVIVSATFALYAAFALKLLVLSRPPGSERSLNLIPFATIVHYMFSDSAATTRFAFANVVGNVLIFLPLGVFLAFAWSGATVARRMMVIVLSSVVVEIVQGLFGLGASDIDDVILNSLGGLLGILAFLLLRAILRARSRVRTAMAVLSIVPVPILCYLMFVVRLRM